MLGGFAYDYVIHNFSFFNIAVEYRLTFTPPYSPEAAAMVEYIFKRQSRSGQYLYSPLYTW